MGGCPQGTFCNAGNCIAGAPPPPSGCFDRCTVPSLFPGATADVEFKAKRNKNVSFYGVAIIPSTGDTNPANNRKEIR